MLIKQITIFMTIHTLVYNLKPDRIIVNRKKSSIGDKPQIVCLFKIQKVEKKKKTEW